MWLWYTIAVIAYFFVLWVTWRIIMTKLLTPWWIVLAVFLPVVTLIIVLVLPAKRGAEPPSYTGTI